MARFDWLKKLSSNGGKLGAAGVAGAVGVGAVGTAASSLIGADGKGGSFFEDAMRTPVELGARTGVLGKFEGIWSTIEQIFKAIVVATHGSFGGDVMNFSRKMQGLDPIGRNANGKIDLNQIKTINHTTDSPSTSGKTPSPDGKGGSPSPTEASVLGSNPLAAAGTLGALGVGKLAYDRANTPEALLKRALNAEAAGKTAKMETLLERGAAAESRAAGTVADTVEDVAKHAPRVSGKFGKAALAIGLIGSGAVALDASQAKAETEEAVDSSSKGFWSNAFQTAAAFTVGVGTGLASIPEDLYDMADKHVARGYLPGDENASGTRDTLYAGAEMAGVDLKSHQTALAGGELASIFIPVAGVAGAVAKSERIVKGVTVAEKASDGLGLLDLGSTGAQIAKQTLNLG